MSSAAALRNYERSYCKPYGDDNNKQDRYHLDLFSALKRDFVGNIIDYQEGHDGKKS
jgi:hypothetical protein